MCHVQTQSQSRPQLWNTDTRFSPRSAHLCEYQRCTIFHTTMLLLLLLLLLQAKEKNIGKNFKRKQINRAKCADDLRFLFNISAKPRRNNQNITHMQHSQRRLGHLGHQSTTTTKRRYCYIDRLSAPAWQTTTNFDQQGGVKNVGHRSIDRILRGGIYTQERYGCYRS